ncbi:hypothetical protein RZS08_66090, partial [Arthrospira platensis SPKY1]|nr:hypothetical protein [Arthrospira platensis SPKY1]
MPCERGGNSSQPPQGATGDSDGDDTLTPTLVTDRAGPYRAQLVVEDGQGASSPPNAVLVVAGDRCEDGRS